VMAVWPTHDEPAPKATAAVDLLSGTPWAGEIDDEQRVLYGRAHFSQFVGAELPDYSSRYLNEHDGVRKSWMPPCRGRSLVVWMFGGSTLFSIEHPDDRTLPSEVAKVAARQGLTLHVRNFGVPGEVSWQSAHRFERQLAEAERPDLVVFYDGWNDMSKTLSMDFAHRGGPTDFVGGSDATAMRMLDSINTTHPKGEQIVRAPKIVPTLSIPRAERLAVKQYAVAQRTASLLARDAHVAFLHLYQPSSWSRAHPVSGEWHADEPARKLQRYFRRRLPHGVVDISDALDASREPLFFDDAHTTVRGTALIARRVERELQPLARQLLADGGGTRCP
jgi:lysophospholipase L1-like esterase